MDLAAETIAFGAYRNGLARARAEFEPDELAQYLEDLAKSRAAMETAWIERMVGGQANP